MSQTRRLAAILAADVAGYSRLIGAAEGGTLARLKALRRELLDPKIAEHRGRLVKTTEDGSFEQNAMELDTAVRHKLPLIYSDQPQRGPQTPSGTSPRSRLHALRQDGRGLG